MANGTAGTQNTFTEPGSGPTVETMYTLNEIMAQAPALDDTHGATPTHVLTGTTFWGLHSSEWATRTGAMPDNEGDNASTAQARPGTVSYFTAPEGYYDGDDRVSADDAQVAALDTDIAADKIKQGVDIFGQAGNLAPGGTATAADLFNGETAHLASDWTLDTGALDLACNTTTFNGTANRVIDAYDGGGDGTNRWCITDSGDAAAADIAQGKIAWVDGSQLIGTAIPRFTEVATGIVQDNQTGLWWLKDVSCGETWGAMTWAAANAAATNLVGGQCGTVSWANHWRLPTIWELYTLVSLPADHPFQNVQPAGYWSRNLMDNKTTIYWYVNMGDDSVAGYVNSTSLYVWPIWD